MQTGQAVRALGRTLSTPSLIVKLLQSLAEHLRRRLNQRVSRRIIRKRGLTVINTPFLLAHKHQWDIRTLGAPEELEVPLPVRVQPPTTFDSQYSGRFQVDPPWVLILPDATVSGPLSTVISANGEVILESQSTSNNITSRTVPPAALRGWSRGYGSAANEAGLLVPLAGYWATGYFHWMAEHLPRLALLPPFQEELGPARLIIPRDPPAWLLDSLDLLGYGPSDLLYWPSTGPVRSRKMVVLSSPRFMPPGTQFSVLRPSMLRFVRERLSSPQPATPDRRLYVTRASSPGRNVSNEDQVRALLEARGFVTVDPGRLSLKDQIEAFAAARVVVGPHGAGLTNIMFSRGADVIELHEADRPKTASFRLIAAAAGHRYGALTCTALKTLHPRRPDLQVDTNSLGRLVDAMDESRSYH